MIFKLRVEKARDDTGEEKRAMFVTIITDTEGLGDINAVAELPEGSPLALEIDKIMEDMLKQRQDSIKANNKKKVLAKK